MAKELVVALVIVSLVSTGGVGCGTPSPHSHGGKLVTEYPRRRKPEFGWTRIPAVYVLYSQKDQPPGFPGAKKVRRVGWELTAVRLEKRSALGFKVHNGSLVAVAGNDQIPLPAGKYCWHSRPFSEPIDWGATVLCGAFIAAAAMGISTLAWLAALDGIKFGPG